MLKLIGLCIPTRASENMLIAALAVCNLRTKFTHAPAQVCGASSDLFVWVP